MYSSKPSLFEEIYKKIHNLGKVHVNIELQYFNFRGTSSPMTYQGSVHKPLLEPQLLDTELRSPSDMHVMVIGSTDGVTIKL